ncbi:MAG: magnesium/cobalt transporter CorA [Candidatus Sericytochromatia bacterium]
MWHHAKAMINFCKLLDANTGELHRHLNPPDISEVRREPGAVIWLDIIDADDHDLALLKEEFGFHTLAIEDCRHAHQRPKLDQYDGYMFMVLYEADKDDDTDCLLTTELNMFMGANYVVTVHRGPARVVGEVEHRWEANLTFEEEGAAYLAYLLIDATVDSYFPAVDNFSDRLDAVETLIFDRFDERIIEAIFDLKKETLLLRRLVTPLRDVFLVLLRGPGSGFGQRTYVYFQDVLDHLLRVSDAIDVQRDLIGSALDAYQSGISNRTNDTMKKLTVLSAVLMTMALIAGIYGMNFHRMPELDWPLGYHGALYMMGAAALVLVTAFRWKGYIGKRLEPADEDVLDLADSEVHQAWWYLPNFWMGLALVAVGGPIIFAPFIVNGMATPVVTKSEFAQLKRGMTLGQIETVIGAPGQEDSGEDDGRVLRQVYTWSNPDGSRASVTLENARLAAKGYERLR